MRAEPYPATLRAPGGFRLLFLTFTAWDVIKYSVKHGEVVDQEEINPAVLHGRGVHDHAARSPAQLHRSGLRQGS
ncbi:hypothetical protein ACFXCR_35200 [Streptomyces sp. NPDC059431]|uniref:hypothetical protein n=1 Tax=unclassified Streptomyces TaxID=2593676 RepID=UPI00368528FB